MGLIFLVVILGAAAFHALKTKARTSQRWVELFLVYLLVCYCGVFVFAVSVFGLVDGEQLAKTFGFSTGGPRLIRKIPPFETRLISILWPALRFLIIVT